MVYDDILSKEELEALLTPEELEVFKAEQHSRLEHELMLSPAHLLLAVRELEDTVVRLTSRVLQLECQLAQKPPIFEPEVLHVVNQVIETALFEMPIMNLENNSLTAAVTIYEQDDSGVEDIEVIITAAQLELEVEVLDVAPEEIQLIVTEVDEEIYIPEISPMEMNMLLSNDAAATEEDDVIPTEQDRSNISLQEEGLISRSSRHRERKPSLLSKLLK